MLGIKRALDNVPVLTGQGVQFSGDLSFIAPSSHHTLLEINPTMPATDCFSVSPSFCLTWSNCLFSCISCCTSMSLHSSQREIFLIVHYVCGLLIFSYVYTHMHVRGLGSVSGAIHSLGPHLPWLLRLAWHPLSRLGWLTQTPQEFICLCLLPQRGITSVCLFHLGSGAWPQVLMLEWQALCRLTHLLSFQKTL